MRSLEHISEAKAVLNSKQGPCTMTRMTAQPVNNLASSFIPELEV
jgi:hypothetical protein